MAGGAGATICAPLLGWGTILRGAGVAAAEAAGAVAWAAGFAGVTAGRAVTLATAGRGVPAAAAGGATTAAGRAAGAFRASASACLRARIAFSASPGFEMCERSKAGFDSVFVFEAGALERWPLK